MKIRILISWVFQVLVAGVLLTSAVAKFQGHPTSVESFEMLGMEPEGRYIVAGLEILAALLLLIPHGIAWGAILGWGVMTGALIAHGSKLGISGILLPMTLMALFNWVFCTSILILRRDQVVFVQQMFEAGHKEKSQAEK